MTSKLLDFQTPNDRIVFISPDQVTAVVYHGKGNEPIDILLTCGRTATVAGPIKFVAQKIAAARGKPWYTFLVLRDGKSR